MACTVSQLSGSCTTDPLMTHDLCKRLIDYVCWIARTLLLAFVYRKVRAFIIDVTDLSVSALASAFNVTSHTNIQEDFISDLELAYAGQREWEHKGYKAAMAKYEMERKTRKPSRPPKKPDKWAIFEIARQLTIAKLAQAPGGDVAALQRTKTNKLKGEDHQRHIVKCAKNLQGKPFEYLVRLLEVS